MTYDKPTTVDLMKQYQAQYTAHKKSLRLVANTPSKASVFGSVIVTRLVMSGSSREGRGVHQSRNARKNKVINFSVIFVYLNAQSCKVYFSFWEPRS